MAAGEFEAELRRDLMHVASKYGDRIRGYAFNVMIEQDDGTIIRRHYTNGDRWQLMAALYAAAHDLMHPDGE